MDTCAADARPSRADALRCSHRVILMTEGTRPVSIGLGQRNASMIIVIADPGTTTPRVIRVAARAYRPLNDARRATDHAIRAINHKRRVIDHARPFARAHEPAERPIYPAESAIGRNIWGLLLYMRTTATAVALRSATTCFNFRFSSRSCRSCLSSRISGEPKPEPQMYDSPTPSHHAINSRGGLRVNR